MSSSLPTRSNKQLTENSQRSSSSYVLIPSRWCIVSYELEDWTWSARYLVSPDFFDILKYAWDKQNRTRHIAMSHLISRFKAITHVPNNKITMGMAAMVAPNSPVLWCNTRIMSLKCQYQRSFSSLSLYTWSVRPMKKNPSILISRIITWYQRYIPKNTLSKNKAGTGQLSHVSINNEHNAIQISTVNLPCEGPLPDGGKPPT
jgi:hypothetical protein